MQVTRACGLEIRVHLYDLDTIVVHHKYSARVLKAFLATPHSIVGRIFGWDCNNWGSIWYWDDTGAIF